MTGKISQIINLYKVDPDNLTLTGEMAGYNKDEFIQDMKQDIKEMEQHVTCK